MTINKDYLLIKDLSLDGRNKQLKVEPIYPARMHINLPGGLLKSQVSRD